MSKLLIYFECASDNFGTLMGAIGPNMTMVENLRVETPPEPKAKITRAKHTNTGKTSGEFRNYTNSKVQQIIYDTLYESPSSKFEYDFLIKKLEEKGFKANSLSAALTYMRRAGLVDFADRLAWIKT